MKVSLSLCRETWLSVAQVPLSHYNWLKDLNTYYLAQRLRLTQYSHGRAIHHVFSIFTDSNYNLNLFQNVIVTILPEPQFCTYL